MRTVQNRRLRWTVALPCAAALVVALASGCAADTGAGGSTGRFGEWGAEPARDQTPYEKGAVVGNPYDYVLYTHCGIEWTRIDGVWWQTAPLNDGNGNPPKGWGNPSDRGVVTLVDERTATYRGANGTTIEFTRTQRVEAPYACD